MEQPPAAPLPDGDTADVPLETLSDSPPERPEPGPALREGIASRNPRVRARAAEALRAALRAEDGPPVDRNAAKALLRPLLSDTDITVRTHAALALIGDETEAASGPLLEAARLGAPVSSDLKIEAIFALGTYNVRDAIPVLCDLVERGEGYPRRPAVAVLGALRAREAVPVLTKALEDDDPWLVNSTIGALGAIGDPSALPAMRRAAGRNRSPLAEAMAQRAIENLSAAALARGRP